MFAHCRSIWNDKTVNVKGFGYKSIDQLSSRTERNVYRCVCPIEVLAMKRTRSITDRKSSTFLTQNKIYWIINLLRSHGFLHYTFSSTMIGFNSENAPVPLLHGWPTISRLDGDDKFSLRPEIVASCRNLTEDSNDICWSGEADDSMPRLLNGLKVPSNVM